MLPHRINQLQALSQKLKDSALWRNKFLKFLLLPTIAGAVIGAGLGLLLFPGQLLSGKIGAAFGGVFVLIGSFAFLGLYVGALILLGAQRVQSGQDTSGAILIRVILVSLFLTWIPVIGPFLPFVAIYWRFTGSPRVRRGTQLAESSKTLQAILKQKERQYLSQNPLVTPQAPPLTIGGIELPTYLETLSYFMVGSPGSGKTQAIAQMLTTLKQRSDFRVIVFDRNGEFLEKFYDPAQDLIFNPRDRRSLIWSHGTEQARPETIAAALIPHDHREPFFSDAARSLLADLYERTDNNAEIWEVLSSFTIEEIRDFVHGGLSARYFSSERTGGSVLSTLVNQARFYRELPNTGEALSFIEWAREEDPRWIFLPLFEADAEVNKPLYSCLFELVIRGLLSNEQRWIKTAVVIDELGALQQLPSLARLLSESRKFSGTAILGTQTEAQVRKTYGPEDTRILLQATATKLILNCRDHETAETFAKLIGHQERIDITRSHTRSGLIGGSNTSSELIRETYAVMPAELQALPPLAGYLAIADGTPPAKVEIQPRRYATQVARFEGVGEVNGWQSAASASGMGAGETDRPRRTLKEWKQQRQQGESKQSRLDKDLEQEF